MRFNNWDTIWQNSTSHPNLGQDCIHLWRANLDVPTLAVEELTTYLSLDEIEKANKFRFEQHKRRFTVSRAILRRLLADYLQITPNEIKLKYGDRGKPYVATVACAHSLQFNISHSQEYALYGFTYDYPIGVDIEYLREMKDAAKIAQRFFSPQEFQLINCLQGAKQQKVFFQLWTAKEAYLKAIGTGLADSLASIDIDLEGGESPVLKAIQGSKEAAKDWSMYPCFPAVNYVGAIAIQAQIAQQQIEYWNWQF